MDKPGKGRFVRKKPSVFGTREDGCWVCKNPNVEVHHVLNGSRRPISEREGLTIPLCHVHHQDQRFGIHFDHEFDTSIKRLAQMKWEEREGINDPEHKEFINVFYENFLTEE